ncbi:putative spindle assembly checkpoint component MAD1 (Mitotic arrest deficient protein 1) [Fasciola gigantica]|uniref:Putative spindle assembly checkpoint component MAD1 (Mitotic arrest deficient protein 1) n=1 Tax=Fasciola gigantica TaxID=46835 RepID=A0A504Z509_FASGI|nr:putative spindle assembly checkpoint component MAD1 (Mitotic arrest deficient protein 1) [Fasciola gigantica]
MKHDLKHTNNTPMSRPNNKSRKSVLDQLIEPFSADDALGSPGTKPYTERNETPKTVGNNFDEENENRTDSLPVSNSIKRTVRFSDSVKVDLLEENGQSVAAQDKPKSDTRPLTADRSKPPVNPSVRSRPHTAPGLSTDVKSSLENLLLDDVSPERPRQTDEMDEFAKVFQSTSRTRIRRPSSLDSIGRSGDSIGFASKQWKEGRKTEAENTFKSQENLSTFVNVDLEARMKRMELEKANLESLLELMKKQHQEELSVVEQAAKSKVELIEEGAKRRESRLKEELKYLEEQRKERLTQLEQQRDQLASELTTKLNEARSHGDQEIARVKALHEDELNRLKMSQEQTIEQVRQACEQEMRVRGELQPNTEQLKRLLEMLSNAAQELSHVEQERSREFTARNEQLIRRENALRVAEEKFSLRASSLDQSPTVRASINTHSPIDQDVASFKSVY